VQDHPRHQHRPPGPDLERVRLGPGAVDHRDRALAEHLEHPVGGDHRGGVLVDPDAELAGGLGHQQQQPPEPVALAEVLVDDRPREQAEAGRQLRQPLLGDLAGPAEGDHVGAEGARPGRGAADDGPAPVGVEQGRPQPGPGHHHGQPQLVAAGHEHPGGPLDGPGRTGGVGLPAGRGPQRDDLGRAQVGEHMPVEAEDLLPERGRGRDHRDPGPAAAGQLDEVVEDGPVAELVLRTTDGHEDAGSGPVGVGGHVAV
jgi:hypothetical protein